MASYVFEQTNRMTYEDDAEAKPPSVGTKVLVFGCAIFAVLGSFWAIVWFIRSYVEPPRVMLPAPMTLAASESKPAPSTRGLEPAATASGNPSAPSTRSVPGLMATAQTGAMQDDGTTGGIADRWAPLGGGALEPAAAPIPAPAPQRGLVETPGWPSPVSAPASLATPSAENDPAVEDVAEGSVPAITGRAPLPRRKPTQTASAAKRLETPLPRPRPDGPAPQSVFTSVGTTDDRFQAGQ